MWSHTTMLSICACELPSLFLILPYSPGNKVKFLQVVQKDRTNFLFSERLLS